MAPRCTICDHAQRIAIEQAMVTTSLRDIATQFEISSSALFRHKSKHVASALAKAEESRTLASANGLIDLVEGLIHELGDLKAQAKQKRNGGTEARKSVETILKAVQVLADLVGANAPKVSVQVQAQVPTREEAIAIAVETLEAFAPHLLAATATAVTAPFLLQGERDEQPE
jgi:hypothetical protein